MIAAEGVVKRYGAQEVLHGVDLTVADGEFLSIMGESGSGKSTLLGILAGSLRPDGGRVVWDGVEVSALNNAALSALRRTKLGFVYQSLNLIPTLNLRDNILLPLYLDRAARDEAALARLAERLRIAHLLRAMPEEVSGGERQRAAIARALLHHASVLMLDEPTGSLDSRATADVMELLRGLNRAEGVTVIQVTHSAAAAAYGSRTVRLVDGRIGA